MKRYLIFLSYIGTKFRGIQVLRSLSNTEDNTSVAGLLEIALKQCKITNVPKIVTSSRTDQGVHALRNAVHVDLESKIDYFLPQFILRKVNKYFKAFNHNIRVQEVKIVPDDFSCRYQALRRHYLYRFAVKKPNVPIIDCYNPSMSIPIPILEDERCHFILDSTFDVEAVYSASQQFLGTKDCIALLGKPVKNLKKNNPQTTRTVESLELRPGRPLVEDVPYADLYNYWEVHCIGKSFLYHQVRRTVGVLIAVAQGHMTLDDVKKLFDCPKIESWNSIVKLAPAYGLYLKDVIYDEQDLVLPESVIVSEHKKDVDWKNFTGSIHEKINLRKLILNEQRKKI